MRDEEQKQGTVSDENPTAIGTAPEKIAFSRNEYLREYDIRIKFHSVGCVIQVGCKSIPFSTVIEGLTAVTEYVNNPQETTEFWNKKFQE
jgi:hypothetical protein